MLNKDEIMNYVGADDWNMVIDSYHTMTLKDIESDLNYMFPFDNNHELAESIYNELNQ